MPQKEQDAIIGQMNDKQIDNFAAYFDAKGKVANQEGDQYAEMRKVANQRKEREKS